MKKILKLLMIILMLLGISLSVLNFISTDSKASMGPKGSLQSDGCYGDELNC